MARIINVPEAKSAEELRDAIRACLMKEYPQFITDINTWTTDEEVSVKVTFTNKSWYKVSVSEVQVSDTINFYISNSVYCPSGFPSSCNTRLRELDGIKSGILSLAFCDILTMYK